MNIQQMIKEAVDRVYNQLGYGLSEAAYQKALYAELCDICPLVEMEFHIAQNYLTTKGRTIQIADLRIDILINKSIILELKSVESCLESKKDIPSLKEYKQTLRYMNITGIKEGYLINFGKKTYDFIKVV